MDAASFMNRQPIGTTTWLTASAKVRPLERSQRSVIALWARTLAVVLAAALGVTILGKPLAYDARKPAAESAPVTAEVDASHTGAIPPSVERTGAPPVAAAAASLFASEPDAAAGAFAPDAQVLSGDRFAQATRSDRDWREDEFQHVTVVDGRTLEAGGRRIRLVGLDLPLPEQMCRTLDARLEPCAQRAATQLELLTRARRLTCLYRVEAPGQAIGRCRLGAADLSERMIRTGYAWPSALPRQSQS
jgi:endonuclease YncB( thermonuclease family)